jgi:hypothetical protein
MGPPRGGIGARCTSKSATGGAASSCAGRGPTAGAANAGRCDERRVTHHAWPRGRASGSHPCPVGAEAAQPPRGDHRLRRRARPLRRVRDTGRAARRSPPSARIADRLTIWCSSRARTGPPATHHGARLRHLPLSANGASAIPMTAPPRLAEMTRPGCRRQRAGPRRLGRRAAGRAGPSQPDAPRGERGRAGGAAREMGRPGPPCPVLVRTARDPRRRRHRGRQRGPRAGARLSGTACQPQNHRLRRGSRERSPPGRYLRPRPAAALRAGHRPGGAGEQPRGR